MSYTQGNKLMHGYPIAYTPPPPPPLCLNILYFVKLLTQQVVLYIDHNDLQKLAHNIYCNGFSQTAAICISNHWYLACQTMFSQLDFCCAFWINCRLSDSRMNLSEILQSSWAMQMLRWDIMYMFTTFNYHFLSMDIYMLTLAVLKIRDYTVIFRMQGP